MGELEEFEIVLGSSRKVSVSFSKAAARLGANFTGVTWSVESGGSASVNGTPVFDNNISTALIDASSTVTGCTVLKMVGTTSEGESIVEHCVINVVKRSCN